MSEVGEALGELARAPLFWIALIVFVGLWAFAATSFNW